MNNSIEKMEDVVPTTAKWNWNEYTPEWVEELIEKTAQPPIMGYMVWTRQNHGEDEVREYIEALTRRQIPYLRTGLSWAEWVDPQGREWIKWYMGEYARHFDVLPCLTFTPPEYAVLPKNMVNLPPSDPSLYAAFVHEAIEECGAFFNTVELWNEWNIETDWNAAYDKDYTIFCEMIALGAKAAHAHGKRVLLGGPSKVNRHSLDLLQTFADRSLRGHIDILGFHNLRGTWSDSVPPPSISSQAELLRKAWYAKHVRARKRPMPVWLTEYGFPPVDLEGRFKVEELELIQIVLFAHAVYACLTGAIERAYWYTYRDEVHESLRFTTTGWEDELQFYFGDTTAEGKPRLLAELLCRGGPLEVLRYAVQRHIMPLIQKASLGRKLPV